MTVRKPPVAAPNQPAIKLTVLQGAELWLLMAALFLAYNYRAYGSFFFDDAFDHLIWTTREPLRTYIDGLITWRFLPLNFRPAGHYFYRLMYQVAGYDFPAWVASLHILHLIAVWLLWLILRRLGASLLAASAGILIFVVNMSAFHVYWRPMYHFDLMCGLFLLLSFYMYQRGNLVLSLFSFWLSYKSKEVAVTLPAILLVYEWWFGGRRWWRVLPFAAISASFTVQAFLQNSHTDTPYTLRLTPAAVWICIKYYANHALFFPFLGLLLPLLFVLKRDRRVLLGLWFALCTLAPMFLLPSRLDDAYLYVPCAGLAIAFVFVLADRPKWVPVAFCVVWLAANLYVLRRKAPVELELAGHNRHFFYAACQLAERHPEIRAITYRNAPPQMASWGIKGVYRLAVGNPNLPVYWAEAPEAANVEKEDRVAIVEWNTGKNKLVYRITHNRDTAGSTVNFALTEDLERLGEGWYVREEQGYCWSSPKAMARLRVPRRAMELFLRFGALPAQFESGGPITISATAGTEVLPDLRFTSQGDQVAVWTLDEKSLANIRSAADTNGFVEVTFQVAPPYQPGHGEARILGVAVKEFGFR